MDDLMIKIENLSKEYRLGQIGGTTLHEELQRMKARWLGQEDPTSMIGTQTYWGDERFLALDDISLEVKKGERVGIIGHNGAGKSTLLKVLSRVTGPSKGTIGLNGRIASMLEVGTGFHPDLTGRENIYMNGAILGMTKKEIDSKIEDIIEFSECRKFIDTPVKRYSSGMYVKLAFSVAAHLDSEIMIMDEVLAVGDVDFQKKCLGKMISVSQEKQRTILYVSHNMNTIRQLCDRCIVLDHGRMIFDGDVEKAIALYVGQNENERIHNDFTVRQTDLYITENIKVDYLDILQTSNSFKFGSSIKFGLTYECKEAVKDLHFRFTVLAPDRTAVGSSSTASVPVEKGKTLYKEFELHTEHLAPGEYIMDIVAFEPSNMGGQTRHDYVGNAMYFSIYNENQLYNFTWKPTWGSQVMDVAIIDQAKES